MKRHLLAIPFLSMLLAASVRAQAVDCLTFSSAREDRMVVADSYGGYYLIGFGATGGSGAESLSIFASRESPDGGSNVDMRVSQRDLPLELPAGTVNGIRFSLGDGRGSSQGFWVTLASAPDACPEPATPGVVPSASASPTRPASLPSNSSPSHLSRFILALVAIIIITGGIGLAIRRRR